LASLPLIASADETSTDRPETIEEVLVTGEQPGPGLWKIGAPGSDRALWILGTHGPLPRKLRWKSDELNDVLRASQELIAPPAVDAKVGPLGGLTLLPSLVGIRKNPDGARLQDVLSPELYARWRPLKQRYLAKNDDVEAWRPIFAAEELYAAALAQAGLERYGQIWPVVEKLARKARVPVTEPKVRIDVDGPRAAIREFKQAPLADQECFARTLDRLESDLDLMRLQANAWAVGDITRLRALSGVDRASACIAALTDAELLRERGLGDLRERAAVAWIDAARSALARNASTVAVLPIDLILKPDGYVARLRAAGYDVLEL
jgi:hypothetical protein